MSQLIGKGSKDRWYPNSISSLKGHISSYKVSQELCPNYDIIKSNISYNLQYLEYQSKTLTELNLSSVLETQTIKYFIIVCISIIEAIFFLICCNQKLRNKINWVEYRSIGTSEFTIDGTFYKTITKLSKKNSVEEFENLTLDKMSKKIERKKILTQECQFFKDLNHLRKLRNKIHLQETKLIHKSDYNSFWEAEYNLSKNTLHKLLTDNIFGTTKIENELFNFLK